jgi:hypothetical protein
MELAAPPNQTLPLSTDSTSQLSLANNAEVGGCNCFPFSRHQRHDARRGEKFEPVVPSTPTLTNTAGYHEDMCCIPSVIYSASFRASCLSAFVQSRKALITFVMSVRLSARINAASNRPIYIKFDIGNFF